MSESQSPVGASEVPPGAAILPSPRKGNGFGLAALILGIFAFVFAFVPFVSYAAIVAGALAVVLGILGLLRKFRPHGASVAGLIIGAIALILAILMTTLYAALFFGVSKAVSDEQKAAAASHTVVYTVTGAAQDADVTYSTFTDGSSGIQQANGTRLPFTKTFSVKGSKDSFSFNSFTVSGINGIGDTGSISCAITVDGKTIATQTSTGSLASVSCAGSN